jgi:hypothetical protein
VARRAQQPVHWIEEAQDPELEQQLVREMEARRHARRAAAARKAAERRGRRLFVLFAVVSLGLAGALAYGALQILRSLVS